MDLSNKLILAVASSAIFDLSESDGVFRGKGPDAYRSYTLERENLPFQPGPALEFIRKLLSLNRPKVDFSPIEVILLSKNDADTGNRVLKSISHHNLPIRRAAFTSGKRPDPYIDAFEAALFLSTNEEDVRIALKSGSPAGVILSPEATDLNPGSGEEDEGELRIAFDFDGILADDASEKIFQSQGLQSFEDHEIKNSATPHIPGPLLPLLKRVAAVQSKEISKQTQDPNYQLKIRTALITSRGGPASERVIQTLRHWGLLINESFFLGGVSKDRVLSAFKPHIFFDDQKRHLAKPTFSMAMVHVPYGNINLKNE